MKIKRILPICFLASSLLLSSCESLLNNLMPNNNRKSSQDDSSEVEESSHVQGDNFSSDDYQGRVGAKEISKAEWEKAFSLEEFALHRSVHLECTQADTHTLVVDNDHGKVKYNVTYSYGAGEESEEYYYEITNLDKKGVVSGNIYYDSGLGEYFAVPFSDQTLGTYNAQFGHLALEYDNFIYDKTSKTYKAQQFTHKVASVDDEESLVLDIKNCEVAIKDGFPSKIEFYFTNRDSAEMSDVHYVANYSSYGAVKVEVPQTSNGNNNNNQNTLPKPEGEEITLAEFRKAMRAKQEAPYNHVVITMIVGSGETQDVQSITADYVYGMWQSENGGIDNSTIQGMMFEESSLDQINQTGYSYLFYYNRAKDEYAMSYEASVMGIYLSANVYFDRYFCVTREDVAMNEEMETIELAWSVSDTSRVTMNVAHREFQGIDIQEKNFVYYNAMKEMTESTALYFDSYQVKMVSTKACSGNEVIDYTMILYGYYSQEGNRVTVIFNYAYNGMGVVELPSGTIQEMEFVVDGDKLICPTSTMDENSQTVDIHLIMEFNKEFTGTINQGSNDVPTDIYGSYYFKDLEIELYNEKAADEANAVLADVNVEDLAMIQIMVMEEENQFIFMDKQTAMIGTFEFDNNLFYVEFTTAYDVMTGEVTSTIAYGFYYYADNGDIYFYVTANDDYAIIAYYSKY